MICGWERFHAARRGRREASLRPRLFILAVFWVLGALSGAMPASADDLAGYSVVPQFGHSSAPTAIAIAPNGRWFATAKDNEIYLWDMQTGEILRRIAGPEDIRFLALSKDGALVLAHDGAGKLWAWKAETGAQVSAADAASAEPTTWTEVHHFGEGRLNIWGPVEARRYFSQQGIEKLVPASESYYVVDTNQVGIIGVDFDPGGDQSYGSVFIDIKTKTLVLRYIPQAGDPNCGEPWGTFAFDGRWLVMAPTAKDASDFFLSAEVIDFAANPPKLKWQHYCRDFEVAGIEMRNGYILASPTPDRTTVYDPASARAIVRIVDIGPTDEGEALDVQRRAHDSLRPSGGYWRKRSLRSHGSARRRENVSPNR